MSFCDLQTDRMISSLKQLILNMISKELTLLLVLLLLPMMQTEEDYIPNCDDYAGFLKYYCKVEPDSNSTIYQLRKAAFQKTCNEVNQHNSDNTSTYTRKLYCGSSDMLSGEEAARLGLSPVKTKAEKLTSVSPTFDGKVAGATLPTSLNYVSQGYVTSVKNQGTCGCCWSFASTAMYQSQLLMRGFSYGLSEEASLQCTKFYAPNNRVSDCSGGYFEDPLRFLAAVGSVLRSNYPYIAGSYGSGAGYPYTAGICSETNRISVGNGSSTLYGPLTQTQVKTLLNTYGPVMVGVYANTAFTQYSSGVFTGCPVDAANYINHAVLLVGYNDATSSWLIKNQWSGSWGESGYIRISYNNDCGLSSLLGNVKFNSLNSNPSITVSSSQLFVNSPTWEHGLALTLLILIILALL